MARIRTIKPEFFTSEDIVSMSPLARLFYVSLWCESDREGRMEWKPKTFKMRYLPGDECDVSELAQELVDRGLIVIYSVDGKQYAEIPTFEKHQVINNRESESNLPAREIDAKLTRASRVKAEGKGKEGREGKGKERKEGVDGRASRLPADFLIPDDWFDFCTEERSDLDPTATFSKFCDYWHAKPGRAGAKLDWFATWRNWVREEKRQRRPTESFAESDERRARERVEEFTGRRAALVIDATTENARISA